MSALPSTRELRALDVVEVVPAGCFALLVMGEAWAPHLQPGELAIVDTADTAPQRGELYALAFTAREGQRLRIVQPCRRDARQAEGGIVYRFGALRPDFLPYTDGPLSPEGWAEKCRGRIVGVMVAR